jgi:hypothetical protein
VVIGDSNIPPIVLAGDDIYLENNQTTTTLAATALDDPDGISTGNNGLKKR